MKKGIAKHLLLVITIVFCLSVLVACNEYGEFIGLRHCCDDTWHYGGVLVARGVCINGSDVQGFIEQYVTRRHAYTVDLPESYSDLVNVSHTFRAGNYKQIFTPDDFLLSETIISFEFNVDGTKIGVFFSISSGTNGKIKEIVPGYGKRKEEGDELKVMQDTPFANPDNLAPLDYDFEANHAKKTYMALMSLQKELMLYLEGYKPSGIFLELYNNRRDENYITEVYSEDGKYVEKDARFFFHDPRDISAEEKQAWQMQVIKDILANMKCYYWAAPEA